ncbi:helix-turn-helix transcriptional regulator, ArsR family [Citrifermentans bemidjiense Bem]|uniref:Helix-turn-helix transcriptional regulator, ArsR family n=1 Tax=Citrifermentans bemidjiense (strain ATCC BAA-1014 / DSM 16622 / JCM 12645 / Bem) TaxID=404380 RepID=B5EAZ8_CITBB|nr:metalloregulator ArsR/SmtB family transcription factor [Citrifermentans bemidjiense]ACH38859.1 helix-turn-helix transcriptional regulator, ArsR family [Citrifermentans bemidjiense Bem]
MKDILQLYKSLSDETRLRILALLLAEGELCVCDIIATLKLPQSTISRQLAILRKTGWVNDRRSGLWIYYSIRENQGRQQELISTLKQQLLGTKASVADREVLARFGRGEGSEEEVLPHYRRVRDEIKAWIMETFGGNK